jgi:hypothetical protein
MVLLQETIIHTHFVWTNVFFYLFVGLMIYVIISTAIYLKMMRKRVADGKLMQQQYLARIDNIRKEHSDTLENIRLEMLKREEERTRQWIESEKETLHVLNGVSNLLDIKEKLDKSDSIKILNKLDELLDAKNKTKN